MSWIRIYICIKKKIMVLAMRLHILITLSAILQKKVAASRQYVSSLTCPRVILSSVMELKLAGNIQAVMWGGDEEE